MSNYRRFLIPGGTYFLTIATYQRAPIFAEKKNVDRLRRALALVKHEQPFDFHAGVVLPDHVHFLWSLPSGDTAYSRRVGQMKVLCTHMLRGRKALPVNLSTSRRKHRESDVWHRRFWELTIQDDDDFEQHLHYIHYNPVKHRYVKCPHLWPYSSFQRWVDDGVYDGMWGCGCDERTLAWIPMQKKSPNKSHRFRCFFG
jgi:putative transposase